MEATRHVVSRPRLATLEACAGVGMLSEGVHAACEHLGLAYQCVGYVERDGYAASTLVARMADASLAQAPVWDDLATFDGRAWRGKVDCLAAGFPCQPWSTAGKRAGTDDARWLWPILRRTIGDVRPGLVYLENVPGLVSGCGLNRVLHDLAEMRFDAEWCHLTAAAVGAPHKRERVFILAYRKSGIGQCGPLHVEQRDEELADSTRGRLGIVRQPPGSDGQPDGSGGALGDTRGAGLPQRTGERRNDGAQCEAAERASGALFPPGPGGFDGWRRVLAERPWLAPAIESGFRQLFDGRSVVLDEARADQLRCSGNGCVPLQAAVAFVELGRRAELWP